MAKGAYIGVSNSDYFDKAVFYSASNCTVNDGTVTQTTADTATSWYWRWRRHKKDGTYEDFGIVYPSTAGTISASFTKDDTDGDLGFGANGSTRDTLVQYVISSLPNGTYTVSVNLLDKAQGSISWNNMKFVLMDSVARKIKKGYIGVNNVARKIKKAYIGIGGVARPCWSGGELAYYGTITALSKARCDLAATSVGNYALFGGGYYDRSYFSTVDAYTIE